MYRFKAAPAFWRSYRKLSQSQQESAKRAWRIFKQDPFDPRLGAHKIHALSAKAGQTVYSIRIEADLRVIFIIDGEIVYTLDIGSHALSPLRCQFSRGHGSISPTTPNVTIGPPTIRI